MRTTCENCGDKLSSKEIRKMIEIAEYIDPRAICDDCANMESNAAEPDYEQQSDADSGL